MPVKDWTWDELPDEPSRQRHAARAHEQWLVALRCWFWIVGPGSRCGTQFLEGASRWEAARERRDAQREMKLQGWTVQTLCDAKARSDQARYARQHIRQHGQAPTPAPTIERDYPCTFSQPAEERAKMFAEAMAGKSGPLAEPAAREVSSAVVSTLFDGDDQGNERREPAGAEEEWWN